MEASEEPWENIADRAEGGVGRKGSGVFEELEGGTKRGEKGNQKPLNAGHC